MELDTPAKRLKWARQQHGQYATASDAARAFGWVVSTYIGHENGDRNPSRAAAKRYAKAYRVRWEWLLEGEGQPQPKSGGVKLAGFVGDHATVVIYQKVEKTVEDADLPPNVSEHTLALEIRGGSMRGLADNGWLIFFEDWKNPPNETLIGRLCVLEIEDGTILVRTLQPGRKKDRYDLESPTEATMRDQKVTWAARVTWIKPR